MSLNDIKPQFYIVNQKYEITVNPDDSHQYLKDEFRFRNCLTMWDKMFTTMSTQEIIIDMCPEISECQNLIDGKHPRIHFHGTILFSSRFAIASFLLKYSLKLSQKSSIQINEYRPEYWQKYITKQKDLMEYLCKTEGFSYPLKYSPKKSKDKPIHDFFQVEPTDPLDYIPKKRTKGGKTKIVSLIDEGSPESHNDSIKKKRIRPKDLFINPPNDNTLIKTKIITSTESEDNL